MYVSVGIAKVPHGHVRFRPRALTLCANLADFDERIASRFTSKGVCSGVAVKERLLPDSDLAGAACHAAKQSSQWFPFPRIPAGLPWSDVKTT